MAVNSLLTDTVLHRLGALAEAARKFRLWARPDTDPLVETVDGDLHRFTRYGQDPGSAIDMHRLTPGRMDCPICRLEQNPVTILRDVLRRAGTPDRLVDEQSFREAERIAERPSPEAASARPICRHPEERDRIACSYGYCVDHPGNGLILTPEERDTLLEVLIPIGSGSPLHWGVPAHLLTTGTHPASRRVTPSYTAETAMEEIRLAGEGSNEGLAATYHPNEGPTAACSACPALVPPEDLWVGKKSGIALCDPCMEKWVKGGRAKRTGEF